MTSGTTPGPAIEDMMERITSPLLLVAAGPPEKDAGEVFGGRGRGGGGVRGAERRSPEIC
jgi:hypothetical protein